MSQSKSIRCQKCKAVIKRKKFQVHFLKAHGVNLNFENINIRFENRTK